MTRTLGDAPKEPAGLPRRFRRFQIDLPITVRTSPAPPHWVPICLSGQTVNVSRAGICIRFEFPVDRHLTVSELVRLEIGQVPSSSSPCTIRAKVAWVDGDLAGFQFTKVIRPSEVPERLRRLHVRTPFPYT